MSTCCPFHVIKPLGGYTSHGIFKGVQFETHIQPPSTLFTPSLGGILFLWWHCQWGWCGIHMPPSLNLFTPFVWGDLFHSGNVNWGQQCHSMKSICHSLWTHFLPFLGWSFPWWHCWLEVAWNPHATPFEPIFSPHFGVILFAVALLMRGGMKSTHHPLRTHFPPLFKGAATVVSTPSCCSYIFSVFILYLG